MTTVRYLTVMEDTSSIAMRKKLSGILGKDMET